MKAVCPVCFRHCALGEGEAGPCLARKNENGRVIAANYGKITALALDPVEKKPLARFHPGSMILSVGSFGCNLMCPFCQNHEISRRHDTPARDMRPEELAEIAVSLKDRGNIGIAFTYNEPLAGYEFVRDTAHLVRQAGMKNVLVTNGTAAPEILEEIIGDIDAMNIDLKAFDESFYTDFVKGSLPMTMEFIRLAAERCHVELTMLVIPGRNDSEGKMVEMTEWISSLKDGRGDEIPLHISRYFPRYKLKTPATDVRTVYHLAEVARRRLKYVYTGNC